MLWWGPSGVVVVIGDRPFRRVAINERQRPTLPVSITH